MTELKQHFDKLIGGIQIQNRFKNKGIGTLACIVYDKNTNEAYGLTNRHILKNKRGTTVIQPARIVRDDNSIIGKVYLKGGKGVSNDYAIFKINTDFRKIDQTNSIYGLQGKLKEYIKPYKGLKVQKIGQNTGHTFGIIHKINDNGTFGIKPNPDKPCEQISKGGDSGSLWVTDEENFKAVGLHSRGEKQKKWYRRKRPDRATAVPINKIFKNFNLKF